MGEDGESNGNSNSADCRSDKQWAVTPLHGHSQPSHSIAESMDLGSPIRRIGWWITIHILQDRMARHRQSESDDSYIFDMLGLRASLEKWGKYSTDWSKTDENRCIDHITQIIERTAATPKGTTYPCGFDFNPPRFAVPEDMINQLVSAFQEHDLPPMLTVSGGSDLIDEDIVRDLRAKFEQGPGQDCYRVIIPNQLTTHPDIEALQNELPWAIQCGICAIDCERLQTRKSSTTSPYKITYFITPPYQELVPFRT